MYTIILEKRYDAITLAVVCERNVTTLDRRSFSRTHRFLFFRRRPTSTLINYRRIKSTRSFDQTSFVFHVSLSSFFLSLAERYAIIKKKILRVRARSREKSDSSPPRDRFDSEDTRCRTCFPLTLSRISRYPSPVSLSPCLS